MSLNSAMQAGVSGLVANSSALSDDLQQHRQREHGWLQAERQTDFESLVTDADQRLAG